MAKLGKKARKFARKNLQSVLKKQRKLKSLYKRRSDRSKNGGANKGSEKKIEEISAGGDSEMINLSGDIKNLLDNLFDEDDDDQTEDDSESEGFFPEDSECPYISESEKENDFEDKNSHSALLQQNEQLFSEMTEQKRYLNGLLEKDPKFMAFLESRKAVMEQSRMGEISSDEEGDVGYQNDAVPDDALSSSDVKVLTSYTVDVWCWLAMEEPNGPAFRNLLNGFRAACRYGVDSDEYSSKRIPNQAVFSKIVSFVLNEAHSIFCKLLGISDSCCNDSISKLRNKSEWETVKPLVKSYLGSSLFLLNQLTNHQILVFTVSKLRHSAMFFAAFPSLARRLIKNLVHLWATGDEMLSSSSFSMLRDIALQSNSSYFDACLNKLYKAFIANCQFVECSKLKHIEFLKDYTVELSSLDIQKSYQKAFDFVQQLANILRLAIKTKEKEDIKKICNWQYINCVSLWVKFISYNSKEYDLHPLLFLLIRIIKGIAHLFSGPRYVPLRLKCVGMLNELSLSCGVFIPIASLLFDSIEQRGSSNPDMSREKINFSLLLKVPKSLLKSQKFQEECILSVIQMLSAHFDQWSYHISFPELATIPLILLKRYHEKITVESLRRRLKHFIDQAERNVDYIEKKRNEVLFSPSDHASVDTFLQLEKSGAKAPFRQYYASVLQNSKARYALLST